MSFLKTDLWSCKIDSWATAYQTPPFGLDFVTILLKCPNVLGAAFYTQGFNSVPLYLQTGAFWANPGFLIIYVFLCHSPYADQRALGNGSAKASFYTEHRTLGALLAGRTALWPRKCISRYHDL